MGFRRTLLTTILAASILSNGIAYARYPEGKQQTVVVEQKPEWYKRFWSNLTHNTTLDHAIEDYNKDLRKKFYPESFSTVDMDSVLFRVAKSSQSSIRNKNKDPIEITVLIKPESYDARRHAFVGEYPLPRNDEEMFNWTEGVSRVVFKHELGSPEDSYIFRTKYGTHKVYVVTKTGMPDSILYINFRGSDNPYDNRFSTGPKFPDSYYGLDLEGIKQITTEMLLAAVKDVKDAYTDLRIEAILARMDDFVPPPKPVYPKQPQEFVITNTPVLADRKKKSHTEIAIEQSERAKTNEEMEKARGELFSQYCEQSNKQNKVYLAPGSSLFATPKLVGKYKSQIQGKGYKKGIVDCIKRAFKELNYHARYSDLLPKDATFISLGSGNAEADADIIYNLTCSQKPIRKHYAIDDDSSLAYASETLGWLDVDSDGIKIDIENDKTGLETFINGIEGSKIIFTKDTDINFKDYLGMYKAVASQMSSGDVLIRAGPLEHRRMLDTYNGIEEAAVTYITELGLNPDNWKYLGPRYDAKQKEWYSDFQCLKNDELMYNDDVIVFNSGDIFRHMTSRRKDLKSEIENLGLTNIRRVSDPKGGYAIDFYVKTT